MVDSVIITRRSAGSQFDQEFEVSLDDFFRSVGANLEAIPAGPLTLSPKHQGKGLLFQGVSTVTVPANLPEGFSCGYIQAGAGQLTFQAGAGATLNSFGGLLKTGGQWTTGGITSLSPGTFLLYGLLA